MILEAHGVRKLYGAYVALDGVSLSIREGEFVSIIGPNGAGKSTLINVLTGVLPPSGGSVRFKGRDIAGIGTVALTRLGMARSFQLVQIFPELSVLETLQGVAADARRVFAGGLRRGVRVLLRRGRERLVGRLRDARSEEFDFLGYTFGRRYSMRNAKPYMAGKAIEEEHPASHGKSL